MESKLSGVPETMLIPLWARAQETRQDNPIIKDEKAVEMVSAINYNFSKFNKAWMTQVGVTIRTKLIDNAVYDFLKRKPKAIIINLGAGLDTRFERLNHDSIKCWYDIDLPGSITLRRKFVTEKDNNKFIARSIFDYTWIDEINHRNRPVLIIAEGLFMYFSEDELKPFFNKLIKHFKGAEMLFEMLAPFMVGKSKRHETVSKISSQSEFKWGLKDSRIMESWNNRLKFKREWNYFDFHKDRWKWVGVIARLPFIRPKLATRIVNITFV